MTSPDVIEVLIPGPQGPASPGIAGGGLNIRLKPDLSSTAAADPGQGFVRFNAALQTGATALYINETDSAGIGVDALHSQIAGVANPAKAVIRLVAVTDSNRWVAFQVTAAVKNFAQAWTYTVTYVGGPGGLLQAESIILSASPFGDTGASTAAAATSAAAAAASATAAAGSATAAAASVTAAAAAAQAVVDGNADLLSGSVLAASEFAAQAADASGLATTASTTSLVSQLGSRAFTVASGKNFPVNQYVMATSAGVPGTWMLGQVTAYSGTSLTVNVTDIGPTAGTRADWVITWSSPRGPQGTTGTTGAAGATGGAGATGSTGTTGATGTAGQDGGLRFLFSTSTSGDPTAGHFAFDNATFTSASKVRFSETDGNNNAVGPYLAALDDSTSSNKALVILQKQGGTGHFEFIIASNVTDQGAYDEFNITPVGTSGSIALNDDFHMTVSLVGLKGDTGATGAGTGDMLAANNLSDLASKPTAYDNISIHGADVASAATLNLDTATGNLVDVTGTTAITAITLSNGRERTVRFTAALTLTNGASLLLPSAQNIATAVGDFAVFRGYAAGVVRCVTYVRANGHPLTTADASIASAGTADLGSSVAQSILITGTTTITSFGSTAPIGARKNLRFAAALTLTYNAVSMILPGSNHIQTVGGDTLIAIHEGSGNWRVTQYTRVTGQIYLTVNAQTGTTYTIVDAERAVTYSNASAVAVTLPQAGASNLFMAGWRSTHKNLGVGVVTITPATSTINGASTLTLSKGMQAEIISDGANYIALVSSSPDEGSWTPVLAGSGTAGSHTYSVQIGRYSRTGNLVTVWFRVVLTALDGAATGNATITGLPFTTSNITGINFTVAGSFSNITHAASMLQFMMTVPVNSTTVSLVEVGSANVIASVPITNLTATSIITGTLTYRIN